MACDLRATDIEVLAAHLSCELCNTTHILPAKPKHRRPQSPSPSRSRRDWQIGYMGYSTGPPPALLGVQGFGFAT